MTTSIAKSFIARATNKTPGTAYESVNNFIIINTTEALQLRQNDGTNEHLIVGYSHQGEGYYLNNYVAIIKQLPNYIKPLPTLTIKRITWRDEEFNICVHYSKKHNSFRVEYKDTRINEGELGTDVRSTKDVSVFSSKENALGWIKETLLAEFSEQNVDSYLKLIKINNSTKRLDNMWFK